MATDSSASHISDKRKIISITNIFLLCHENIHISINIYLSLYHLLAIIIYITYVNYTYLQNGNEKFEIYI